jgi:hypothetical protein
MCRLMVFARIRMLMEQIVAPRLDKCTFSNLLAESLLTGSPEATIWRRAARHMPLSASSWMAKPAKGSTGVKSNVMVVGSW